MAAYSPPLLDKRIRLRNPGDRPEPELDDFGRPTGGDGEWGVEVWAARRDSRPAEDTLEQVTVRRQLVVWTIRRRAGVAPDAEVVHGGEVYASVGPPRIMGGVNFGVGAEYMELHTQLLK